jgi:hypothetical protein
MERHHAKLAARLLEVHLNPDQQVIDNTKRKEDVSKLKMAA